MSTMNDKTGGGRKTPECPNLAKGQRCPVCGAAWICKLWKLPKRAAPSITEKKESEE